MSRILLSFNRVKDGCVHLRNEFREIDQNHDHKISLVELKATTKLSSLSQAQVEEFFKESDHDMSHDINASKHPDPLIKIIAPPLVVFACITAGRTTCQARPIWPEARARSLACTYVLLLLLHGCCLDCVSGRHSQPPDHVGASARTCPRFVLTAREK